MVVMEKKSGGGAYVVRWRCYLFEDAPFPESLKSLVETLAWLLERSPLRRPQPNCFRCRSPCSVLASALAISNLSRVVSYLHHIRPS